MNKPEAGIGPISHVVLICEDALEELVGRDIIEAGAKGYTVSAVRGRGNRGVRDAQWLLSGNVRFEILCDHATGLKIMSEIEAKYSRHYGLVAFMHEAVGPRADKF